MIRNIVISGKKLPVLTNPASSANIQSGYEAINSNGEKITGTKVMKDFVTGTIKGTDKNYITNGAFSGKTHVIVACNEFNAGGAYFYCCCQIANGSGKAVRGDGTFETATLSGNKITCSGNNYWANSRTFWYAAWVE